jgi:hypothetical protein
VVAGDALGFVDRERVGVIDPAPLRIAAVEHDPFAGRQEDVDAVVVDVDDGDEHPVLDGERVAVVQVLAGVVPAEHHPVAGGVGAAADLELVCQVEVTGVGEELAGELVQQVCFGAGAGEHQRFAGCAQLLPVCDGAGVELVGVVGEHDPAVLEVGGERSGDVAVAELIEGGLFPQVLLATVDGQLDDPGTEGVQRGTERATCADLG